MNNIKYQKLKYRHIKRHSPLQKEQEWKAWFMEEEAGVNNKMNTEN